MFSKAIEILTGLFAGGAGKAIGNGVTAATLIAALAPLGIWFVHHKDETVVTLAWGDLAFWGAILFVIVLVTKHTPPQ